jgi:hypothetical protein
MEYKLPTFGTWNATKTEKPEDGVHVLGIWFDYPEDAPDEPSESVALCFRELNPTTEEYHWYKVKHNICKLADAPLFWADMLLEQKFILKNDEELIYKNDIVEGPVTEEPAREIVGTGTHTPGPWTTDAWGDHQYDVYGPDDHLICELHQEYCEKTGQGLNQDIEHDANLIAASPELLSALKGVSAAHSHVESSDLPRWLNDVEEAIAKAEGRLKVSDPPYNEEA